MEGQPGAEVSLESSHSQKVYGYPWTWVSATGNPASALVTARPPRPWPRWGKYWQLGQEHISSLNPTQSARSEWATIAAHTVAQCPAAAVPG